MCPVQGHGMVGERNVANASEEVRPWRPLENRMRLSRCSHAHEAVAAESASFRIAHDHQSAGGEKRVMASSDVSNSQFFHRDQSRGSRSCHGS
jgi:hypothetical protein